MDVLWVEENPLGALLVVLTLACGGIAIVPYFRKAGALAAASKGYLEVARDHVDQAAPHAASEAASHACPSASISSGASFSKKFNDFSAELKRLWRKPLVSEPKRPLIQLWTFMAYYLGAFFDYAADLGDSAVDTLDSVPFTRLLSILCVVYSTFIIVSVLRDSRYRRTLGTFQQFMLGPVLWLLANFIPFMHYFESLKIGGFEAPWDISATISALLLGQATLHFLPTSEFDRFFEWVGRNLQSSPASDSSAASAPGPSAPAPGSNDGAVSPSTNASGSSGPNPTPQEAAKPADPIKPKQESAQKKGPKAEKPVSAHDGVSSPDNIVASKAAAPQDKIDGPEPEGAIEPKNGS